MLCSDKLKLYVFIIYWGTHAECKKNEPSYIEFDDPVKLSINAGHEASIHANIWPDTRKSHIKSTTLICSIPTSLSF